MKTSLPALAIWLTVLCAGAQPYPAAPDLFLKIILLPPAAPLTGSSTDPQFPGSQGWIPLIAAQHGSTNGTDSLSPTQPATTFPKLHLVKELDVASPILFQTTAQGVTAPEAQLVWRHPPTGNAAPQPYYAARLLNVILQRVEWSQETPREAIDLLYNALQWTYHDVDAAGMLRSSTTVNFDAVRGRGGVGPLRGATIPLLEYSGAYLAAKSGVTISPSSGPGGVAALFPLIVQSRGGYTGALSLNPVTGAVTLSNATPVGGPFPIVIRATDIFGGITDATLSVTVSADARFLGISRAQTNTVVRLLGTPGRSYQLQKTSALPGPWSEAGMAVIADANGLVTFTESSNPSQGQQFYRALELP